MRTVELILDDNKDYGTREAFNTLRTNLLFSGRDVKTILITSCLANEGKSTISFETAVGLARVGKKVLLIDADLRKSAYASRYTKETGLMGLSQYLSGQSELDGVLYATQIPTLNIIFSGPFPPNPTELVGASAFGELLKAEREHYDYILIDTPRVGDRRGCDGNRLRRRGACHRRGVGQLPCGTARDRTAEKERMPHPWRSAEPKPQRKAQQKPVL